MSINMVCNIEYGLFITAFYTLIKKIDGMECIAN